VDHGAQLKPYPRIGRPLPGSITGLRSWPVQGFEAVRIYYLESTTKLRVVRILRGRLRWPSKSTFSKPRFEDWEKEK
jgi:plasmid stabilization system protein ParE